MARVVFVNDEVDLVELCTLTLEEVGYEAYGFTDVDRAIEAMLRSLLPEADRAKPPPLRRIEEG